MLSKRRSEVDPPPPPPGQQNVWSKFLSEHGFKAQIPSQIKKKFWGLSAPKSGSTHPTLAKKIWEKTRTKRREQGFHSGGYKSIVV